VIGISPTVKVSRARFTSSRTASIRRTADGPAIAASANWSIQPDLQYIFHPGANIANPANPVSAAAIPNALAFGLRTALQF
jgi:hypothetical protein